MRNLLARIFSGGSSDSGSSTPRKSDGYSYDHYTDAVEDIKQLKREKRHDEAEDLLLWCINAAESDSSMGLPRWYYKHLGIVYRKEGRYDDEVAILERYLENTTSPHEEIANRIERARELASED